MIINVFSYGTLFEIVSVSTVVSPVGQTQLLSLRSPSLGKQKILLLRVRFCPVGPISLFEDSPGRNGL